MSADKRIFPLPSDSGWRSCRQWKPLMKAMVVRFWHVGEVWRDKKLAWVRPPPKKKSSRNWVETKGAWTVVSWRFSSEALMSKWNARSMEATLIGLWEQPLGVEKWGLVGSELVSFFVGCVAWRGCIYNERSLNFKRWNIKGETIIKKQHLLLAWEGFQWKLVWPNSLVEQMCNTKALVHLMQTRQPPSASWVRSPGL